MRSWHYLENLRWIARREGIRDSKKLTSKEVIFYLDKSPKDSHLLSMEYGIKTRKSYNDVYRERGNRDGRSDSMFSFGPICENESIVWEVLYFQMLFDKSYCLGRMVLVVEESVSFRVFRYT